MGSEVWKDCPEGALTAMVTRLRSRRRRDALTKLGVVSAGLVLLLAGYAATTGLMTGAGAGRITCQEASSRFVQYHEGTLDAVWHDKVEEHLNSCVHCRRRYQQAYPREAQRLRRAEIGELVAVLP